MTTTSDRPETGLSVGVRLTPDSVRRLEFAPTPLGRRGYDEADVDGFRSRVVLEIVTADAEKAELRQEIQRLRDYYRHRGGGTSSDSPATGISVDAVNMMSRAQQAADQHIAQAEEYARRLVASARTQYEEILLTAREQAEQAEQAAAEPSGPQVAAELIELESRLTYLRTFAQVTQVQLRSVLAALGEEIDHLEVTADPADPLPPRTRPGWDHDDHRG